MESKAIKKIRVLIVDDSVLYRSQIKLAMERIPRVEVVGVAATGKIALDKVSQMEIDLLTLDLEMPEMSGIDVLKGLRSTNFKGKVLVFSSLSKRGAEITLSALSLGATDFLPKPGPQSATGVVSDPSEKIRELMVPKIESLFSETAERSFTPPPKVSETGVLTKDLSSWKTFLPDVLVIGCSTGGPSMLEKMFLELRQEPVCPFLIVQHMPPEFTEALAARLSKISGLNISEAKDGMLVQKGRGYLAPGDYHMKIKKSEEKIKVELNRGPQINSVRPAVDPLFESAAQVYGSKCLGLVLTGMGADGRDGASLIKNQGGCVLIQSESSCVVFGMPGAVKSVNAFDMELSPEEIIHVLKQKVFASFRIAL